MRIVTPPGSLSAAISEELSASLGAPGNAIVQLAGTSNAIAIATVVLGERASGRIIVGASIASDLVDQIRRWGIAARIGKLAFESNASPVTGTDHRGSFVVRPTSRARIVVYFALNSALLDGSEEADVRGEHRLLGRLFGYPDCCVDAYASQEDGEFDRTSTAFLTVGPFDRAANPVTPYVYGTANLLFHFPCRADCRASNDLRRNRAAFLVRNAPSAGCLESLGAGIALYGSGIGIGLVTEFDIVSGRLFVGRQVVTRSHVTRQVFEGLRRPRIALQSPSDLDINGHRYADAGQLAAVFA